MVFEELTLGNISNLEKPWARNHEARVYILGLCNFRMVASHQHICILIVSPVNFQVRLFATHNNGYHWESLSFELECY